MERSLEDGPKMLTRKMNVLSVLALLLAGGAAVDISDELADGWKMGLRPRASTVNLQTFSGALGGVKADAVRDGSAERDELRAC